MIPLISPLLSRCDWSLSKLCTSAWPIASAAATKLCSLISLNREASSLGYFWERCYEAISSAFLCPWNALVRRDDRAIWDWNRSPPHSRKMSLGMLSHLEGVTKFLLRNWLDVSSLQQTNSEDGWEDWLSVSSENLF